MIMPLRRADDTVGPRRGHFRGSAGSIMEVSQLVSSDGRPMSSTITWPHGNCAAACCAWAGPRGSLIHPIARTDSADVASIIKIIWPGSTVSKTRPRDPNQRWLSPGPTSPATRSTCSCATMIKSIGLPARPARNTAWQQMAHRAPAEVVADELGAKRGRTPRSAVLTTPATPAEMCRYTTTPSYLGSGNYLPTAFAAPSFKSTVISGGENCAPAQSMGIRGV